MFEIRLRCDDCGSPTFRLTDDREDILSCNGCGQDVGTVAEINAQISKAGKSLMPDRRNRLRGMPKRL